MAFKTDHDKYKDAATLLDALKAIQPDPATMVEAFHSIGSRCQWCQENLNSWLLLQIYLKLAALTKTKATED